MALVHFSEGLLDESGLWHYDKAMKTHTVSGAAGLLTYLLKTFPENSRTKMKQLLKYGAVMVNEKPITKHDHALEIGDQIDFRLKPRKSSQRPTLEPPFPVVYEDTSIIVIEKPPGLLTVSTEKVKTKTAYYALTDYVQSTGPTGQERIFIVHRLDRDASGLLVFAKSEAVKRALQGDWNKTEKKYYAIVEGTPKIQSDTIESQLEEDKFRRVYSSARSRFSKFAATHYQLVKSAGKYSLLEVTLLTGRKNQIRVHLADRGHPIVGDEKYGCHSDPAGRLGLHACHLSLTHPLTKERMTFKSELPQILGKLFTIRFQTPQKP